MWLLSSIWVERCRRCHGARSSSNLQRSDLVVCEHEREIEIDGASGEVTGQPRTELDGASAHRSIEGLDHILVFCFGLLHPCRDGIEPLVVPAFLMHPGLVCEPTGAHLSTL